MALNVVQTKTTNNTGEVLSGFDAIHYRQDSAAAHEGTLTDERISQELESYYNVTFEKIDPEELAQMSGSAAYDTITRLYDEQTVQFIYDDYFSWLIRPWAPYSGMEPTQVSRLHRCSSRHHARRGARKPRAADARCEHAGRMDLQRLRKSVLDGQAGRGDASSFIRVRRRMEQRHRLHRFRLVRHPRRLRGARPPVFRRRVRGPHRQRAPLLPLRKDAPAYGEDPGIASVRGPATSPCALSSSAACRFAAYGAGGADLPIQVLAMGSPYDITVSQAALISVGLAFLMTMGFAGLTLSLSLAPALDAGRLRHRRGARAGDGA